MQLTCSEMRSWLDRYFDGDLHRREKIAFLRHVKTCSTCRILFQEELDLEKRLEGLPVIECPDLVLKRIQQAVRTENPQRSLSFADRIHNLNWKPISLGFAVTAAILFLLLLPPRQLQQPQNYSQAEIEQAREQAKWSLAVLAETIDRSEKNVVTDVFGKQIPETLQKCLRNAIPLFQGGGQ